MRRSPSSEEEGVLRSDKKKRGGRGRGAGGEGNGGLKKRRRRRKRSRREGRSTLLVSIRTIHQISMFPFIRSWLLGNQLLAFGTRMASSRMAATLIVAERRKERMERRIGMRRRKRGGGGRDVTNE